MKYPKIVIVYEETEEYSLAGQLCEVFIDGKRLVFCSHFEFRVGPKGAMLIIELLNGAVRVGNKKENDFQPNGRDIESWNCYSWEKISRVGEELGKITLEWRNIPFELVKKKGKK